MPTAPEEDDMSAEVTAAEVMETDVRSVPSKMAVVDLEDLLVRLGIGGAPVVDDGKLVGVVSRSDIVRHLAGDYAAESIETEYYWDMGGPTSPRDRGRFARADEGSVENALVNLSVADLMIEDIISVAPESPVSLVAGLMVRRHIHRVLVVDGDKLEGVLTTMDLARLFVDGRAVAQA
jgi:CBS domain-containing protein